MIVPFRCSVCLTAVLLAGSVAPTRADLSRRTILATGDVVPGFGSIGTGGFSVKAVLDDGRLLVAASLSDGRQGLFVVDQRRLTPVWMSDQAPGVTMYFFAASAQATGATLLPAYLSGAGLPFFYVFTPGDVRVIHPPSIDQVGNTLCSVDPRYAKINPAGDVVAFQAEIAPRGRGCFSFDDAQRPSAVYVTRGTGALELSTNAISGGRLEPIGVADDGTVIAVHHEAGADNQTIIAASPGASRRIIGSGDPGPSGAPLSTPRTVSANNRGDIAFVANEGGRTGLYRTDGARLIRVASLLVSPTGAAYTSLPDVIAFNDAGDIAFAATWTSRKADGSLDYSQGVVLYPARADARIVFLGGEHTGLGRYATPTGEVALNGSGAVAFGVQAHDGEAGLLALRFVGGTLDTALASGDPGPDHTVVAEGGLNWYASQRCLAPDGRVATTATSVTGHEGLVCIDADGPHLIVQSGSLAPDGYAFDGFSDCRFTDDGGVVFSGGRGVPCNNGSLCAETAVFIARSSGIERLFGNGDAVSNGTHIDDLDSSVSFVANAKGSALVRSRTGYVDGLFLRHDGRLDVVRYGVPTEWALADDDQVVMIENNVLLGWKHGRFRVIARIDDNSLPGAPFDGFTNLMVRGALALFTAGRGNGASRSFYFRLGEAVPRPLPAAIASPIVDFASQGHFLTSVAGGFRVVDIDGRDEIFVPAANQVWPFGINDRGNVAIYSYANPPNSTRQTLELIGPVPDTSARCPQPMTPPARPPETPAPTPTLIVGSGLYRAYVTDSATDTLTAIDTDSHELLATVTVSHSPTALAASPDGTRIFVLADSTVNVLDAANLQMLRSVSLGQSGVSIVAAADNVSALVNVWARVTGEVRIAVVDSDSGLVRSILMPRGRVFATNPNTRNLLALCTTGNPCADGELDEIDPDSGAIVRRGIVGQSPTAAALSPDGRLVYVADSHAPALLVVDLATFGVVGSIDIGGSFNDFALTADGRLAYASRQYSTYHKNPDGSYGPQQGYLSVIDLVAGTFADLAIPGGATESVAVTPDGGAVFTTLDAALPGSLAVMNTETNAVTSLMPGGRARAVIVAPAPAPASFASPTPRPARVLIRADDAVGVVRDDVPIAVRMDSGGLAVASIEHDLLTSWDAPLLTKDSRLADCALAPGVDAVATFESACLSSWSSCDRVHVKIRASSRGSSLPDGVLYTCTAYLLDSVAGLHISGAKAVDLVGHFLPVFGADSEVRALSQSVATPRPTRTPRSTATPTITVTPTATMLPVVIEVGSATISAGSSAAISVVLHTNGATVAGAQNDLGLTKSLSIAAAATGEPQCVGNPAIAKHASFSFVPAGCDYAHGECTALRAIVVSLEDVNPIADHSSLYTCVVEVAADAPVGNFPLRASALYASDPHGMLLRVGTVDGSITVVAEPTSQPTPIPTIPPRRASPSPTPIVAGPFDTAPSSRNSGSGTTEPPATSAGGCNLTHDGNGFKEPLVIFGLTALVVRLRRRVRRSRGHLD